MLAHIPITAEAFEALQVQGLNPQLSCTPIPGGMYMLTASETAFEKVQSRLRPGESVSHWIIRVCEMFQ